MSGYQLRMRKNQRLEDFFQSMLKDAWDAAKEYFDIRKIQSEDFRNFEAETRAALQQFITAYDVCGLSVECADEVEGAPWLDYDDNIYRLILQGTFPEFVRQISFCSSDSLKRLAKPGFEELICDRIGSVFRRHLAEHLYYNPICQRADICKDSRSVNLWNH